MRFDLNQRADIDAPKGATSKQIIDTYDRPGRWGESPMIIEYTARAIPHPTRSGQGRDYSEIWF